MLSTRANSTPLSIVTYEKCNNEPNHPFEFETLAVRICVHQWLKVKNDQFKPNRHGGKKMTKRTHAFAQTRWDPRIPIIPLLSCTSSKAWEGSEDIKNVGFKANFNF